MKPIRLAANRFPRFYRGGSAIDELRGGTPEAGKENMNNPDVQPFFYKSSC